MRKCIALTIATTIVLASCAHQPPRFAVTECQKLWVVQEEPCPEGSDDLPRTKRVVRTGCVLEDHKSNCRVGVLRYVNERAVGQYSAVNPFEPFQPKFLYARLYDWECPAGVFPPAKDEFHFVETYNAPVACDEEEDGLPPINPLLRKKPAVQGSTEGSSEPGTATSMK